LNVFRRGPSPSDLVVVRDEVDHPILTALHHRTGHVGEVGGLRPPALDPFARMIDAIAVERIVERVPELLVEHGAAMPAPIPGLVAHSL
jgi:hypothetical protein